MRVLCIGLDSRVAIPARQGHAVTWTREMSRLLTEYVVLAEGGLGHRQGPVAVAENATAWLVPGNPITYPFAAAAFAEQLHAREAFDLVTTEDPIRAGLAGALFSKRTGVPLNVENHSLHINEPVWLHSRVHHRIYNRLGIWVARQANSIRNYSPDQVPPLVDLGIDRSRLFCLPPPCPTILPADREASREALGIGAGERVVLTAGRLVPYKNVGTLIDAFARVASCRPARLIIAGEGPSQAVWEPQADALGIGDRVTWVGEASECEIAALYAAADVFVAPAVHETGPRTVMEAFMAGCPVVATPRMGVVHFGVCEHGRTGLVAPPDDAEAMADSIEWLLARPDRARAMATLGRARTIDRCNLNRITREMACMFRETVQRAALENATTLSEGAFSEAAFSMQHPAFRPASEG